jgi:hypothetical protein
MRILFIKPDNYKETSNNVSPILIKDKLNQRFAKRFSRKLLTNNKKPNKKNVPEEIALIIIVFWENILAQIYDNQYTFCP